MILRHTISFWEETEEDYTSPLVKPVLLFYWIWMFVIYFYVEYPFYFLLGGGGTGECFTFGTSF